VSHSLILAHASPSPDQPPLQAQVKDPSVLVHDACAWQLFGPPVLVHSFQSGHSVELVTGP